MEEKPVRIIIENYCNQTFIFTMPSNSKIDLERTIDGIDGLISGNISEIDIHAEGLIKMEEEYIEDEYTGF